MAILFHRTVIIVHSAPWIRDSREDSGSDTPSRCDAELQKLQREYRFTDLGRFLQLEVPRPPLLARAYGFVRMLLLLSSFFLGLVPLGVFLLLLRVTVVPIQTCRAVRHFRIRRDPTALCPKGDF